MFALVGAAAVSTAAWQQWDGVARVWMLLGLTVLWAALDHALKRNDGRWYALATLWAALDQLFTGALLGRPVRDAAFVGSWPLAMWGTVAVLVAQAAGLWRSVTQSGVAPLVRGALWPWQERWCCSG